MHLSGRMFARMSDAGLFAFLDTLAGYADLLVNEEHHWLSYGVVDGVREAVLAALQRPTPISPLQFWAWLEWTEGERGYETEKARGAANAVAAGARASSADSGICDP